MKLLSTILVAAIIFIPANASALDLRDGFLTSGSLVISQKIRTQPLAPLHGFFAEELVEEKVDYSTSGSIVVGGSLSSLAKEATAGKAPLIGFFQNDILADPETKKVFDSLKGFSDSGSITFGGML